MNQDLGVGSPERIGHADRPRVLPQQEPVPVGPEEVEQPNPDDVVVGLIGRGKRDQDARELAIIHVEDKRSHE